MNENSVLGLIFAHSDDRWRISELNTKRTFASIPFGGKYRLIDFPVSNMANSGIDKIGVIIQNNYHSLMDHLGSGKAYGLSKRKGGLYNYVLSDFGIGSNDLVHIGNDFV